MKMYFDKKLSFLYKDGGGIVKGVLSFYLGAKVFENGNFFRVIEYKPPV